MSQDASGSSDGTQSGSPATTFNDPLSGAMSTGIDGSMTNGTFTTGNGTTVDTATGSSATPTPDTVRTLLDGIFSNATDSTTENADGDGEGERGSATATSVALADGGTPIQPAELPRDGVQPGMLPRRRRTWPIRQRLTPHSLRPPRGLRVRERARNRVSSGAQRGSWKPSKGAAGVTVVFLLLLLFAFVTLEFIVSFIGMFSGIGS